jgi:hypothetical protein
MKKNIVFVGDSYCSSFRGPSPNRHESNQQQHGHPTWLNVAAKELNLNLYSFGYAGRSWWFSRDRLFRHIQKNPDFVERIEVMVFVHTDYWRFNSCKSEIGMNLIYSDPKLFDFETQQLSSALKDWINYLRDDSFQIWAQMQWFEEINRKFKCSDFKKIHLFTLPFNIEIAAGLDGMIVATPLIHISLGEVTGTDSEVADITNDMRANHMSPHNNVVLGKYIVNEVQNYKPGTIKLDLSDFERVNFNASRWPEPGFGTK